MCEYSAYLPFLVRALSWNGTRKWILNHALWSKCGDGFEWRGDDRLPDKERKPISGKMAFICKIEGSLFSSFFSFMRTSFKFIFKRVWVHILYLSCSVKLSYFLKKITKFWYLPSLPSSGIELIHRFLFLFFLSLHVYIYFYMQWIFP